MQKLLTQTDVGERIGISRQRIHQLYRDGKLPQPCAVVRGHPVWLPDVIDSWHHWRKRAKDAEHG